MHSYDISYDCTPWSGMDCNCYVSLWISWIDGRIAVGKGTRIGNDVCNQLDYSWTTDINVTDIYISSNTIAYWLFAFPENTTSACSTNGTDGTVGIGPETINTTETTLPEFVSTTTSKIETTTPGFDSTSINSTETTTPGFYLTSINTTVTTTPGFFPTTISTTETTFPGYNPTTISATETTTPGFAPISVGMVNTTPGTTKNIKTTSTKKSCICPCSNFTMTEDELIKKIAQLKSELSVDPKLTSKYKRSLVSASDDRPSSKYIGTFELQCNCYVSLWVSWIGGTIKVGGGSEIGTNRFTSLPINDSIAVTDILIKSHYTAYRLFDFLENSTSACTTDGPDGGLESNPETMNTTETTAPEFDPTSIIITDTTLPGLDQTTISTMETRTTGFTPTTLSTTETTSPGFNPTTISSIETNTPGFDQTSVGTIITRATTTSETTTNIETNKIPCICSCYNVTLTEDELITKISLLKSELSVDKKQTNKYRRSLISAEDDRPSSKYIGNFGIVVLVVICSLIVLMDFQHCAGVIFLKKK
ncbi:unnamed protein product [Mytilus edulis]|uniref:Uncharacterized protein n=1 Tax=Mytilus edulis TaxID=6550 RepID=A0A8S3V800_MYTED|nr:unnamed protein product [Mytilus edulis]